MMEKNYLLQMLVDYAGGNPARFHMPGHGGNGISGVFDETYKFDITETEVTDDLLRPFAGGPVEKTESEIAKVYSAKNALISASGATLALRAALLACARKKHSSTFALDRGAHSSVINAIAEMGGHIKYFDCVPEKSCLSGCAAALLTTPDYYGRIYPTDVLFSLAEAEDIPVIIDNSHGAHLEFYDKNLLPHRFLRVDSLHKTTPALTGSALLLDFGLFEKDELKSAMRLSASTSPSYVIAASAAQAVFYMEERGRELLDNLLSLVTNFKERMSKTGFEFYRPEKSDPFRIVICDKNAEKIYAALAGNKERPVICEFAEAERLVLIPSVFTTKEDFDAVYNICKSFGAEKAENPCLPSVRLRGAETLFACDMHFALLSESEEVDCDDAAGRIAAETVSPYPPGIPALLPGQTVTNQIITLLKAGKIQRIRVIKNERI